MTLYETAAQVDKEMARKFKNEIEAFEVLVALREYVIETGIVISGAPRFVFFMRSGSVQMFHLIISKNNIDLILAGKIHSFSSWDSVIAFAVKFL